MKGYVSVFIISLVVGLATGRLYFNRISIADFLTAVRVSDVEYMKLSESSVRVSFKTSQEVTTKLEYGTTTMYGVESDEEVSPTKDHAIVLPVLLPGKDHNFWVHIKTPSGKVKTSENFVIKAQ